MTKLATLENIIEGCIMETLTGIQRAVEKTITNKLTESISREMKYPLPLIEYVLIKGKKIKIYIEIYDDTVLAYLADDRDIFAEGETIKKAKVNLRKSLLDEFNFLIRYEKELSDEFAGRL